MGWTEHEFMQQRRGFVEAILASMNQDARERKKQQNK